MKKEKQLIRVKAGKFFGKVCGDCIYMDRDRYDKWYGGYYCAKYDKWYPLTEDARYCKDYVSR